MMSWAYQLFCFILNLAGDDNIVVKPNLGYCGVNKRFDEESIHYYVNDEFGPRMRPDSTNEYHYTLM